MRYSASEKFEIIELVEQSSLSIRRTLAPIGIPRSTFYDWYSRYQEGGIEALEDGKPRPQRVWNKIPDAIGTAIVHLALEEPDLSPARAFVCSVSRPFQRFFGPRPVFRSRDHIVKRTEAWASHSRIASRICAARNYGGVMRKSMTGGVIVMLDTGPRVYWFNIAKQVDTAICQAAKFLNALLIDQRFVLFHVDKIRLSREIATNIQSFGSED